MRFGVRLPGPFRVGISSRGKVNVGATLGPFSVSTGGARRSHTADPKPVVLHGTLDECIGQAQSEGWYVAGRDQRTAFLRREYDKLRLDEVRPGVVHAAPMDSQLVAGFVVLILGVIPLLCVGFALFRLRGRS